MLHFDLESDGLLEELTRIHCIHIIDHDTDRRYRFNDGFYKDGTPAPRDGSIEDGVRMLEKADAVCGHNIIPFDLLAIQKLFPDFQRPRRVFDTLIASRIIYPHLADIDSTAIRKGRRPAEFTTKHVGLHKLEAWGYRLGVLKGEFKPSDYINFETGEPHTWATIGFTQDMDEYGAQDPAVSKALYELLISKGYSDEALELEFQVAEIIMHQERFGFLFDREAADDLERILRGRIAELEDLLRDTFPPWVEPVRKNGQQVVLIPKRDNARLGYKKGVPVPKFKTVSFNPASRDHIANRLITLFGWQPVEFTETGKPKVDETTLEGLDYPEAKLLVEYLTVEKRLGQLADGKQAWLKKVRPDGRLHGRVNTVGAITRRMTHSDPNMAQVPSVRAPYGALCRALFTVPNGYRLVGCDAEGLELRMLAHYMAKYDGGAYGDTVVNGSKDNGTDVHTVNQRFIGLNSRDSAKTWIYAYLYGAGNLKLGLTIYEDFTEAQREAFNRRHPAGSAREKALARLGKKARDKIEAGLPALGKLQEKVKRLASRKYLKTVDGGKLRVRSAHAALNTLLQGGGAVVMKKALVILYNNLVEMGFKPEPFTGKLISASGDVLGFVANIHDEFQMEVPEHLAEQIGQLAAAAIRSAGEAYNLRCPLAGAYEIGRNWADSH